MTKHRILKLFLIVCPILAIELLKYVKLLSFLLKSRDEFQFFTLTVNRHY